MTGGTNRSLEDLLREQLHEMDTVEPPDPDFEFRALRAGRERLKRRQAWTRGLVGAAAAIVIGAIAIPSMGRLGTVTGGASSGSAVAGAGWPPAVTLASSRRRTRGPLRTVRPWTASPTRSAPPSPGCGPRCPRPRTTRCSR